MFFDEAYVVLHLCGGDWIAVWMGILARFGVHCLVCGCCILRIDSFAILMESWAEHVVQYDEFVLIETAGRSLTWMGPCFVRCVVVLVSTTSSCWNRVFCVASGGLSGALVACRGLRLEAVSVVETIRICMIWILQSVFMCNLSCCMTIIVVMFVCVRPFVCLPYCPIWIHTIVMRMRLCAFLYSFRSDVQRSAVLVAFDGLYKISEEFGNLNS